MPLLDALQTHNLAAVRAALEEGESPNFFFENKIHEFEYATTTKTGFFAVDMTPLIYAIDNRLEDIALLLLDFGADPNPQSVVVHPLNLACKHGFERVVEKLLKKEARFNVKDRMHDIPALEAIKAAMLARDPATGELTEPSMETTKNIIAYLIQAGVRLNPEDNTTFDAQTPIYQAATNNPWTSKQLVDLLIDLGATINLQDSHGITLLEYLADSQLHFLPSVPQSPVGRLIRLPMCFDSCPEYLSNEPAKDGSTLIASILELLLKKEKYSDIFNLVNTVTGIEVTDERRNALSIVVPRLLSAKRVIRFVFDQSAPIVNPTVLSYLNFFGRIQLAATSKATWTAGIIPTNTPDNDSKDESTILGKRGRP
jgi:hypothetical protein